MTEHHNKESEGKEDQVKETEEHNFRYYCRPDNFARILGNKKSVYGIWGLIAYLGHFFLIIIGLNLYCDSDRRLKCGPNG